MLIVGEVVVKKMPKMPKVNVLYRFYEKHFMNILPFMDRRLTGKKRQSEATP